MNTRIFKPRFSSLSIFSVLFIAIFMTCWMGLILPRVLSMWLEFPGDARIAEILFPLLGVPILIWIVVFVVIAYSLLYRKIEFKKNLLFFSRKKVFGGWESQIFNLDQLQKITLISKKRFNGRFYSVSLFFLIENDVGKKEEVDLFGWDKQTLKEVLVQVRTLNKKIKIDTPFFGDSLLVLSGLSEYLEK